MKRVSFAVLSLLGLAGLAAPARADDLRLDFGLDVRDGRVRDGYVGVGAGRPTGDRPTFVADPTPWGRHDRFDGREPVRTYVPAHLERRVQTVCEPAVYEDRQVPVFEDRVVPVFREVSVPVFDERLVPTFEIVFDRRAGYPRRVQVGVHSERVQVGTRLERVRAGERHERIEVGTRTEHVLVRAERCYTVEREVWVPGAYLALGEPSPDRGHDRRGDDRRFDEHRRDRR